VFIEKVIFKEINLQKVNLQLLRECSLTQVTFKNVTNVQLKHFRTNGGRFSITSSYTVFCVRRDRVSKRVNDSFWVNLNFNMLVNLNFNMLFNNSILLKMRCSVTQRAIVPSGGHH